MPHSLTFLYCHVVFSTKYRIPWIGEEVAPRLYAYMASIAREKKCHVLEINGFDDHVHLLVNFHASRAPSAVIGSLKTNSSRIGKELLGIKDFGWQEGYGGFSISASQVEAIRRYIRNQRQQHQTETFEDEMRRICKIYDVEPDEAFLKGLPAGTKNPSGAQSYPSNAREAEGGAT